MRAKNKNSLSYDFEELESSIKLLKYNGEIVGGRVKDEVPEKINGKPITSMVATFKNCTNLYIMPVIPNTVKILNETFMNTGILLVRQLPSDLVTMQKTFMYSKIMNVPTFPSKLKRARWAFAYTPIRTFEPMVNGIIDLTGCFMGCKNLKIIPNNAIPNSVRFLTETFKGTNLMGYIPALPNSLENAIDCFTGTHIYGSCYVPSDAKIYHMFGNGMGNKKSIVVYYNNNPRYLSSHHPKKHHPSKEGIPILGIILKECPTKLWKYSKDKDDKYTITKYIGPIYRGGIPFSVDEHMNLGFIKNAEIIGIKENAFSDEIVHMPRISSKLQIIPA